MCHSVQQYASILHFGFHFPLLFIVQSVKNARYERNNCFKRCLEDFVYFNSGKTTRLSWKSD